MVTMPGQNLISQLRRRIKDQQFSVNALTVMVTDTSVTSADLELLPEGRLILTVTGGATARGFNLGLSDVFYDTVGKLYHVLQRFSGIAVALDRDADQEHSSLDLESFGPMRCIPQGVTLRHRCFSDWELDDILKSAIGRHNPAYTVTNVPPNEAELVLALAEALVYRRRAGDASKRRGTDTSVSELLQLAASLEGQYEGDLRRLRNVVARPPEAPAAKLGTGDVVVGSLWRRSARNGFKTPMAVAEDMPAPVLQEEGDGDAEDNNVKVRWEKVRDVYFHSYELWMDTQENVLPQRESVILSGLPTPTTGAPLDPSGADRPTTSKLVFRAFGASSNYSTVAFSTFIESYGQNIVQFNVPDLEPETDYYFRLRVVDLNFVGQLSRVIRVRTKRLRVRFTSTPCTPTTGPAGTVVTVNFDPTKGAPNAATQVWLGGRQVPLTLTGAYVGTVVVPAFQNTRTPKDLVVVDDQGLKDIKFSQFTVTV